MIPWIKTTIRIVIQSLFELLLAPLLLLLALIARLLPKQIDVGGGQIATFIDGGLSLANNPAFQLFLIATLKGFP